MNKKIQLSSILVLFLIFIVGCGPAPIATPSEEPDQIQPVEPPQAITVGDDLVQDIDNAADTDSDLDTSELNDVDDILAEIENI